MEFTELDFIMIKAMIGWIGTGLCFMVCTLCKRIIVKKRKDELELKQWELSLKDNVKID